MKNIASIRDGVTEGAKTVTEGNRNQNRSILDICMRTARDLRHPDCSGDIIKKLYFSLRFSHYV